MQDLETDILLRLMDIALRSGGGNPNHDKLGRFTTGNDITGSVKSSATQQDNQGITGNLPVAIVKRYFNSVVTCLGGKRVFVTQDEDGEPEWSYEGQG